MKEIPLAAPSLGAAEVKAATEAILSGWVTQGPRVQAFEEAFANAVGARHACAVSSCTAALHLALLAVGVRPGDVVLTASHSFIATANAVRHCGAEPVFVDVDPRTLNLDGVALRRSLRDDFESRDGALWYRNVGTLTSPHSPLRDCSGPLGRLAAIQIVHQVGMPANLEPLLALAQDHAIPVVEDAACAIGSEIMMKGLWERIGKPHGQVACFSFHPRKVITTGDGGMLTTSDASLDQTFRMLRHHGMALSDYSRHKAETVIFEKYLVTGFNYRMTDIQAAIGIEQLRRLEELIAERRQLASAYREHLAAIPGVEPPVEPEYARTNWQSYVIRLKGDKDQKLVMDGLKSRGISTRRGVMCAHLEPPYADAWPKGVLPNSELLQDRGLILPLYPGMSEREIARVAEALKEVLTATART